MSFLLENLFHSQDLLSVLTNWNTQYDQHGILLICNLGQRVTTQQSFLSLHSPLIRTLLDNIPPSVDIPAISVSADVMAVRGLFRLLTTGNTSSECGAKLEEVEKAAALLGITLTNCEIVDNSSRRTPVVSVISPIMTAVKNIAMNTLSLNDTVDQNCASTQMPILRKGGVRIATSIFKEKAGREKSVFPVSRKIDNIIRKIKEKSEIKEIVQNMPIINQRHVCQICDRSFTVRGGLSRHYKMKHLGELRCECQMCGESFSDMYTLKRHVNRKHGGDYKGLRCNDCGKHFNCTSALKRHSSIHFSEKPYKCVICETQFTLERDIKIHLNKYHTGADHLSDGNESGGNEMYESHENSGDNLKITQVRSLLMEEVPNLACE